MKDQLLNLTLDRSVEPRFGPIDVWCRLSGMSRRVTYDKLGDGTLTAVKVGARTLVDLQAGLLWLRSLLAAEFAPPRRKAQLQRQAERREQRVKSKSDAARILNLPI